MNETTYEISARHYSDRAAERLAGADRWLLPILTTLSSRPGARALDVGCAVGTNSVYLAKQGYEVTGLDFSRRMLGAARTACRETGLDNPPTFVLQDFCSWVPEAEPFDLVLATAFVHLFPEPLDRTITDALLSHVAPGGSAIISTTVEANHSQALRSKHEEGPGPGQPLSDLRWRNHYTRESFQNVVTEASVSRPGGVWSVEEHVSRDPGRPQKFWSDMVVTRIG
ncbi:class I SAM-dependent methyltransferase [Promicromonospora sukumoe]|uniref:2-polyprenyl-3-methyl-5-hydroxy-6-metoxy-1, 4-benzoquinol methylase n=1 Tax=Promicromonospora sukumoe TaxID=88382 RepID=A0A7W3PEK1_9MICO|nr:class I SAM-dependent methyltransferase [Promicromonospora sukumoe]MBA8808841.1 2-polyprenyl-3-methyl-5-hydroxy-6-metoxy-1,4-benzoquinol methylase [Promicromonospora sukumoe]